MAPPRVSPPGSDQMHRTQQKLQNPQTLCCRMARAARSLNQPHPARGNQKRGNSPEFSKPWNSLLQAGDSGASLIPNLTSRRGSPAAGGAQEAPMAARQGAPRPGRSAEPCAAAQRLVAAAPRWGDGAGGSPMKAALLRSRPASCHLHPLLTH